MEGGREGGRRKEEGYVGNEVATVLSNGQNKCSVQYNYALEANRYSLH